MDCEVSLDSGEILRLLPSPHPEPAHYPSLPVVYTASGEWGELVFQSLAADGFTLWHARFLIRRDVGLRLRTTTPLCVLHGALDNHFDLDTGAPGPVRVKEGQFNLVYFPAADMRLRFAPGRYAGFGIGYSLAGLRRLLPDFTGLSSFLQRADAGAACRLAPGYCYASPAMLHTIQQMLALKWLDAPGRLYLECEAGALLALALRLLTAGGERPLTITPAARERMEDVRRWLQHNLDHPGSLAAIARRFAINEFSLKRDFKAVFGSTVFDYLLQLRMQRAEQLLTGTGMPITDIAYIVGYSSGSHFSDAFRRHFGCSPSSLRGNHSPGL